MAFTSLYMACSLYNFQTSQCVETLFTIAGYQTPSRRKQPHCLHPSFAKRSSPHPNKHPRTSLTPPPDHPPNPYLPLAPADRLCQEKGREKRIKTGAHRIQKGGGKEKKEKRRGGEG
ncbi:hypothetical protein CEXT_33571 [Caerostris extrusa]|uniref:Uncharacterized protein n=1 Tax=Caerostris extrusa TaxID=172846 RepID=A0AAV4PVC0_CAEEX|nr:hypothetical protein CEXT_33571 [Caerostris extrusa]